MVEELRTQVTQIRASQAEMQAEMQASQVQMKQALLRIERQRGSVVDDADADAETFAAVQADVEVEMTTRLEQLREATEALANESEPPAKQQGVLRCRDARAALVAASKNVQDIGTALGVVVGFLARLTASSRALPTSSTTCRRAWPPCTRISRACGRTSPRLPRR